MRPALHARARAKRSLGPYDIILGAGQSNQSGRGVIDATIDVPWAVVSQYGGCSTEAATYRLITPAADPLAHPDQDAGLGQALGPGLSFAKQYYANTGRRVMLVPTAFGGTALVPGHGGSPGWSPYGSSNTQYLAAIDQTNRALAAALAAAPGSKVVGIFWIQGEADGANACPGSEYQPALNDMFVGMRAAITGASNAWIIIGQMMPEAISANVSSAGTSGAGTYPAIDAAHTVLGAAIPGATKVSIGSGYDRGDHLHYNAPGVRLLGVTGANAVPTAIANAGEATPGQVTALAAGTITASSIQLNWSAPSSGGTVRDYEIQYAPAGSGSWSVVNDGISTAATYTVPGLSASTSYDFRVRARNYSAAQAGAFSSTLTAATIASGLADAFVQLTSITGTHITQSGSSGAGWTYTTTSGAVYASDHAGTSSLKMPAGVSGSIRGAITTAATVNNWILALVTSQSDPAYSAGAAGYKFGLIAANTGNYKVIVDGGASTITPNGNAAFAVQAGDIMQLVRSGSTIIAQVARAASPTLFTVIHTFVATSAADLWGAVTANSVGSSAIGPLIGNGWA